MLKTIKEMSLNNLIKNGLFFLILSLPFFAFLTIFLCSIFGHYTAIRLYPETVLLILMFLSSYYLIKNKSQAKVFFNDNLIRLIILFSIIDIVAGLIAYYNHGVSLKAFGYGLIIDLRIYLVFTVGYLISLKFKLKESTLYKLILYPAIAVVGFGLLQILVLPNNFLSHFGYNKSTILPFETINNNSKYVRIISFLRGSNPLGTYLILPFSALFMLLITKSKDRLKIIIAILAAALVLLFSFSRSSWIGVVLAIAVIIYFKIPSTALRKKLIYLTIGFLIIISIITIVFRNNTVFSNLVFHTQANSKSAQSSDGGHLSALKSGINDIAKFPLGSGTGTAGPASVYNVAQPRIAENFYIQIGQETGVQGLIVFLCIQLLVIYRLFKIKSNISLVMLASFIGISFVNLLSHAWADQTIAYVWWGLAGLIISRYSLKSGQ